MQRLGRPARSAALAVLAVLWLAVLAVPAAGEVIGGPCTGSRGTG